MLSYRNTDLFTLSFNNVLEAKHARHCLGTGNTVVNRPIFIDFIFFWEGQVIKTLKRKKHHFK